MDDRRPRSGKDEGGDRQEYDGSMVSFAQKKDVKCFKCGKRGHYANKCDEDEKDKSEDDAVSRRASHLGTRLDRTSWSG